MVFRIQGVNFLSMLEDIQFKIVRTYKGEIVRTLDGTIPSFPLNFITFGFDVKLMGTEADVKLCQQILLSANVVEIELEYDNVPIKGMFSLTQHSTAKLRDRDNNYARMTASIVSDGSNIMKPSGEGFKIKYGTTTIASNLPFAKVYKISSATQYKLRGAKLPDNQVLVMGDTEVTV